MFKPGKFQKFLNLTNIRQSSNLENIRQNLMLAFVISSLFGNARIWKAPKPQMQLFSPIILNAPLGLVLEPSNATISPIRAYPCPQTSLFHLTLSTRTERTCFPGKYISTKFLPYSRTLDTKWKSGRLLPVRCSMSSESSVQRSWITCFNTNLKHAHSHDIKSFDKMS